MNTLLSAMTCLQTPDEAAAWLQSMQATRLP